MARQKRLSGIESIHVRIVILTAILLLLALVAGVHPVSSAPNLQTREFARGDVLISVGNGQVQWRDPNGNLIQNLGTRFESQTMGLAFNLADKNLYVTDFDGENVSVFDSTGNLIGPFGSGYNGLPESILFDRTGNVYIGEATPEFQANFQSANVQGGTILKFDTAGNPLAQFQVEQENRGSGWIDLAPDQCTMYYTSEGNSVKRYDVCTNQQLPDFATDLPGASAFALRLLPDDELLVADTQEIFLLDASGKIKQKYGTGDKNEWFALDIDPDGKSFWAADDNTQEVIKFDITTGNQLLSFNAGTGICAKSHSPISGICVGGLAIVGEIIAAQSTPTPPPPVIPTPIPPMPPTPAPTQQDWFIIVLIGGLFLGAVLFVGTVAVLAIVFIVRSTRPEKDKTEHKESKVKAQSHDDMGQQVIEPNSTQRTPAIRLSFVQGQVDYSIETENPEKHKGE